MTTDQTRIGEKARQEPQLVFTSLYHHISDVDNLRACYETLAANKATGVDGVTNYYAITDNSDRCHYYVYRTKRILFKWLNRKSQRKAYTWKAFEQALLHVGWPSLSIRKDLNPFRRMEAC